MLIMTIINMAPINSLGAPNHPPVSSPRVSAICVMTTLSQVGVFRVVWFFRLGHVRIGLGFSYRG